MVKTLCALIGSLALVLCGAAVALAQNTTADEAAFEANRKLGRAMNLGNALDAEHFEGEWGLTIKEEYLDLIKQAGFTGVRIPIRWSAHTKGDGDYVVDSAFMARVDEIVKQALARDLVVMINVHHYNEMNAAPMKHIERLKAIWRQVATHFASAPDNVLFELFNEPNGKLDEEFNSVVPQLISTIRETNPERILVVGSVSWNDDAQLPNLQVPEDDRRIIVTFHYYDPYEFTHQGTHWNQNPPPLGRDWGSAAEFEKVSQDFAKAAQWGKDHNRPLFVGEFGVYTDVPMAARARWTANIVREAEKHGMSWAYWEFAAREFGAYDQNTKQWRPQILEALIHPENVPGAPK